MGTLGYKYILYGYMEPLWSKPYNFYNYCDMTYYVLARGRKMRLGISIEYSLIPFVVAALLSFRFAIRSLGNRQLRGED